MTAPRREDAARLLEQRRKRGLVAIHAAKRQLGLDDGAYRDLLEAQTGKRSAKLLTLREQGLVLDHMRRHGATHPTRGAERARTAVPAPSRAAQLAKVHALLGELHRVTGEPHTLAYCDAICARNGWCTRVDFAGPQELRALIGALSRTLRAKARAAGQPSPY
jgi:hypothetical protein